MQKVFTGDHPNLKLILLACILFAKNIAVNGFISKKHNRNKEYLSSYPHQSCTLKSSA